MNRTNQKTQKNSTVILGIDVGTSGIRGSIVKKSLDSSDQILASAKISMPTPRESLDSFGNSVISQDPQIWIDFLTAMLDRLARKQPLESVDYLIVDATSSTVLLFDLYGNPVSQALMYNDNHARSEAALIEDKITQAGAFSGASGASSSLAKILSLAKQTTHSAPLYICHQVDFINYFLCGVMGKTDENNALKLGYDSINQRWPSWVLTLLSEQNLSPPKVIAPGEMLDKISPKLVKRFGFSADAKVMAGTTDSIAGFLASGACQTGDAVSSLGSTLAIKWLSNKPVFDSSLGLYSHKLADQWLVGGASNSGGKVLLQHYSIEQLTKLDMVMYKDELKSILQENRSYYPLPAVGERFPVADPDKRPELPEKTSCNASDIEDSSDCLLQHINYFRRLTLGLTQVEVSAYQKLQQIAGQSVNRIFSVGGGLQNKTWMQFRHELLPAPLISAENLDAAYGVTKLIKLNQ